MWQDIALTAMSILFSIILIPMILDSVKGKVVNLWSALNTTIGLYITSAIYSTIGLYFAATTTAASATMWLILTVLAIKYR